MSDSRRHTPDEVLHPESSEKTIVIFDDDTYEIESESDYTTQIDNEELKIVTEEYIYICPTEDWTTLPDTLPSKIGSEIREQNEDLRIAKSDISGFPVEVDVSIRCEEDLERTLWRQDLVNMEDFESDANLTDISLKGEVTEDGEFEPKELSFMTLTDSEYTLTEK